MTSICSAAILCIVCKSGGETDAEKVWHEREFCVWSLFSVSVTASFKLRLCCIDLKLSFFSFLKTDILEPKDILKLTGSRWSYRVKTYSHCWKSIRSSTCPCIHSSIHSVSLYLLLIWYQVPLASGNSRHSFFQQYLGAPLFQIHGADGM